MIDNTKSILQHDPNFARVYMKEKKLLLEYLQEGDKNLLEIATRIVDEYYEEVQ